MLYNTYNYSNVVILPCSTMLAVAVSVHPSQASFVTKWLHVGNDAAQ